jgi:hypothetical protein
MIEQGVSSLTAAFIGQMLNVIQHRNKEDPIKLKIISSSTAEDALKNSIDELIDWFAREAPNIQVVRSIATSILYEDEIVSFMDHEIGFELIWENDSVMISSSLSLPPSRCDWHSFAPEMLQ